MRRALRRILLAGALLWAAGIGLNVATVAVNHGMPTLARAGIAYPADDARHHLATRADRWPLLWDRWLVGVWEYSIGDVVTVAGLVVSGAALAALFVQARLKEDA